MATRTDAGVLVHDGMQVGLNASASEQGQVSLELWCDESEHATGVAAAHTVRLFGYNTAQMHMMVLDLEGAAAELKLLLQADEDATAQDDSEITEEDEGAC